MVCCAFLKALLGLFLPTHVTGVLLTTALALWFWWHHRKPKNTPPGPIGFPLLGSIPFLRKNPNSARQLAELSKRHGPVVSFNLGMDQVVVINDLKLIRQALQEDAFSGRPDFEKELWSHKDKTMLFSEGLRWMEQRKFAINVLKEIGVGKTEFEPKILEEVSNLVKYIGDKKSRPFDILLAVTASVGDIMNKITMGERFEYDDPMYAELCAGIHDQFRVAKMTGMTAAFPWMRQYPVLKNFGYWEKSERFTNQHLEMIQKRIDAHKKNYTSGRRDDFIDVCFTEKEQRKKNGNHPELFDEEALLYDTHVLQAVTTGAASGYLTWSLTYAAAHPDIQRRIQAEIDDVLGPERQPSTEDLKRMPYTEAFGMEVHRQVTILPFYHPHRTIKDTTLAGYTIPAHTTVFPNAWGVHHDPKLWNDPDSFRPERFLDEENKVIRPDQFQPFGTGKRSCGGLALARAEAFLYLTSILQKFTLQPQEGSTVSLEGVMALFHVPPQQMIRAVPREQ